MRWIYLLSLITIIIFSELYAHLIAVIGCALHTRSLCNPTIQQFELSFRRRRVVVYSCEHCLSPASGSVDTQLASNQQTQPNRSKQ